MPCSALNKGLPSTKFALPVRLAYTRSPMVRLAARPKLAGSELNAPKSSLMIA
ncbi:hypothetical protein D3C85_1698900 [compost metagenome]